MLIILDTVNTMVHTILNNKNKGGLKMKCDRCGTEIYSDAYEYEDAFNDGYKQGKQIGRAHV